MKLLLDILAWGVVVAVALTMASLVIWMIVRDPWTLLVLGAILLFGWASTRLIDKL